MCSQLFHVALGFPRSQGEWHPCKECQAWGPHPSQQAVSRCPWLSLVGGEGWMFAHFLFAEMVLRSGPEGQQGGPWSLVYSMGQVGRLGPFTTSCGEGKQTSCPLSRLQLHLLQHPAASTWQCPPQKHTRGRWTQVNCPAEPGPCIASLENHGYL